MQSQRVQLCNEDLDGGILCKSALLYRSFYLTHAWQFGSVIWRFVADSYKQRFTYSVVALHKRII